MKRLTILRHAKAASQAPDRDDFARPLTERGRSDAGAVGKELKASVPDFDVVLASPAVRVRETLQCVEEAFGDLPDVRFEPGIYMASASVLHHLVNLLDDDFRHALLVGHNPGLHQLVFQLALPDDRLLDQVSGNFPTAAAARLESGVSRWRDMQARTATIAALILPRNLR